MTLRVTPAFKRLLDVAAEREQRSRTNLIEKLVLDHCRALGLTSASLDDVVAAGDKGKSEIEGA